MKQGRGSVSAAEMTYPPAKGRQTPTGKWVRTLEGYLAFLPDPLPPPLEFKPRLVNALASASTLVGRLAILEEPARLEVWEPGRPTGTR